VNPEQAQPNTADKLTLNSSSIDTDLLSNEGERARPYQDLPVQMRQESKQEKGYTLQNAALQRLFRPAPTVTPSSQDERVEQESSSVEPSLPIVTIYEWGRTRQKTLKQHTEDWQVWEETNRHATTTAYRHDRCHDCLKPMSSTSLNPHWMLLCYECTPNVINDDSYDLNEGKTGYERRDRDDEEEWGGVPIPQSDDSSSSESEEEENSGPSKRRHSSIPSWTTQGRQDLEQGRNNS
jgi:hypothetical protein